MPLCGNCFHELHTSGPCPLCGYDGTGKDKKHPQALRPGAILNGRYIVGRVLGQGGFGITYLALDDPSGERVAIKEYYPSELAGRGLDGCTVAIHSEERAENFAYGKAQFLEEARTLAAVSGSGSIVRIYSYFEENGTAYFAMEYVEGVPLDEYLRQKSGQLTAQEAETLFLPLMAALETVHKKGIVHRDIAPDNIIVTKDGASKLIDFGAARYSTGEKSRSLDVILKHGFAPCEQYMRRGRQGPWTDVYALAATFYYAVTGKVPPEAVERMQEDSLQKPSDLGVNLGKGTEAVLIKALSVQAQERWQNMGEFRAALQAAAMAEAERKKGEPERKERKEREKSAVPAEKKKSPLPLVLAAVAVLALMIFGVTKIGGSKAEEPTVTAAATLTEAPVSADSLLNLDYVLDLAGLFTQADRARINMRAAELYQRFSIPVYILIVSDFDSSAFSSIEIFAENQYSNLGLGNGENRDGLLLVLSMAERDYDIMAHGPLGKEVFTDDAMNVLADSFLDNFTHDDWAGGSMDYYDACFELLEQWENDQAVPDNHNYYDYNQKDVLYLKRAGSNSYYIVESSVQADKTLVWDDNEESFYDSSLDCWLWYNTAVEIPVWQYWYQGISSNYGDYGWMEHDDTGWYIEASYGNWIMLPAQYDTSKLWYID